MSRMRSILSPLLATFVAGPSAFARELVRYEWQAPHNASYYEGVTEQNGRRVRFRTRERFVLLDHDANLLELRAVNRRAWRTKPLPTTTVRLPTSDRNVLPTAPQAPSSIPPLPAVMSDDPNDPWPQGEKSEKKLNYVTLGLGLGREEVTAKAGVSEFAGDATIGTSVLRLQHQPTASRWLFQGHLEAHRFTTQLVETDVSSGEVRQSQSRVLRIFSQAELLYDFGYRSDSQLLAIGGGLTVARLPAFRVNDTTTKASKLDGTVATGPHLSMVYGWTTAKAYLGASSYYEPVILNAQTKGNAYGAVLTGHRFLIDDWSIDGWLGYRKETTRVEEDCEEITACSATSNTVGRVLELAIGLGYRNL